MKLRECIFDLVEADDGGLVFTGTTSDNHDDYYLVKVYNDCVGLIEVDLATSEFCFGDSILTLVVSASGGTEPYTYLWSDSSSNDTIYLDSYGVYTVTVTDSNGCQPIGQFTFNVPDTSLYTDSVNAHPACYNDSNGFIFVQAGGGAAPYSYEWSNGQFSALDSNLSAETYTVTITDANGCAYLDTFILTNPTLLGIVANTSEDTICFGDTIDLSSTPSGGTSPYTYLWSNTITSQNQTGLILSSDSTFHVSVTDSLGCSAEDSVSILVNQLPVLSFTSVEVWRSAKDFPLNHAEPSGGSYTSIGTGLSAFVYSLSNEPWFKPTAATTVSPNSLPIVPIKYTYTDSFGCSNSIVDTITVYTDCGTNTGGSPPVITGGVDAATKFPKALASEGESVVEDLVNNETYDVFFVGSFKGKTRIGHRIFESVNGSTDIVVGMYDGDVSGSNAGCGLVWLETFGGSGDDFGHAVEVENPLNSGNVYIGGQLENGYTFGFLSNNTNDPKGYVLELDYLTGTYVTTPWGSIVGFNDQAPNTVNDIAITQGGDLGFAGWAEYGSYDLNFAGINFTSGFNSDAMVGVFDNSGNEAAMAMVVDVGAGIGHGIETSGQDFLMVGESVYSTSSTLSGVNPFGSGNLTYSSNARHILLTKFPSPYTTLEAHLIGNSHDNAAYGIDGALNGSSDYIVTGMFKGTVDFGCGNVSSTVYNSNSTEDAFAFKMSASGACGFSTVLGDDGSDDARVAYVHSAGNIYVAAGFENSAGVEREVLVELNTSTGATITSFTVAQGAPTDHAVYGLASNIGWGSGDHVLLASGFFNDSLTLNNTIYESGNDEDGFIARVAFASSSASAFKRGMYDGEVSDVEGAAGGYIVFPNPADHTVNFILASGASVSVYDISGKRMFQSACTEGLQSLDVSKWSAGIYLLTIDSSNEHKTIRFAVE